jgi:hypothetical protein
MTAGMPETTERRQLLPASPSRTLPGDGDQLRGLADANRTFARATGLAVTMSRSGADPR